MLRNHLGKFGLESLLNFGEADRIAYIVRIHDVKHIERCAKGLRHGDRKWNSAD